MHKEDQIERQIIEEDKKFATKEKNYFNNTASENYNPGMTAPQNPGFTMNFNNPDHLDVQQQQFLLSEMAEVESKIIWELENWKKTEEAKYRYSLRQREIEFLRKLEQDWKAKEIDRERNFQEHENKLIGLQTKLKNKTNELSKREQRIIQLEEELKQKIQETSRQLANKDEEVNRFAEKISEEKIEIQKKLKDTEIKLKDWEKRFKLVDEEYKEYKIAQENSPVNLLKEEMHDKQLENSDLKRELNKMEEVKEEYRKNFDRMKNEIQKLREDKDNIIRNTERNNQNHMEYMRNQQAGIGNLGDSREINALRNDIAKMATAYNTQGGGWNENQQSPYNNNANQQPPFGYNANTNYPSKSNSASIKPSIPNFDHMGFLSPEDLVDQVLPHSEQKIPFNLMLNKLIDERDQLLMNGYDVNDPLTRELNNEIYSIQSAGR